jgi:hypothetical protein
VFHGKDSLFFRYRKRGETEIHSIRPTDPLSRGLRRKAIPVVDLKQKDVKEKRSKDGCIVM